MKVCWNLTNLCNEECIYCFRELEEKARPLEDNITIINKLKNIGVETITFAGGEPFIYPEIEELLQYSTKLGIKNNIITNGKSLTLDNLDKYLPYLSKITFSIDSPSAYINNISGRGSNHYKHIKELLPYIRQNYPNIVLEVNSVVTKENLGELDFMFESLRDEIVVYGLKKWKISRFCPLRGYAKERRSFLDLEDQEFLDVTKDYRDIRAPFKVEVRNIDAIDANLVISPSGSLRKSNSNEEKIIVDDILKTPAIVTRNKILSLGGTHV